MFCTSLVFGKEAYIHDDWRYINVKHPFNIVYYIISGSAFYETDGVKHRFEPGKLYILPANKTFSAYEDKNAENKMKHLYFHAYLYPALEQDVCLDVESDEFLSMTIRELRNFTRNENSRCLSLAQKKLFEMLISYLSDVIDQSVNGNTALSLQIKHYVENNYIRLFKNNDIESVFGYSMSRLNQIFRTEYGTTISKYRDILVVKHIVSMLKEGRSSKSIAVELGFSSSAAFCRFFKTKYGISPSKIK